MRLNAPGLLAGLLLIVPLGLLWGGCSATPPAASASAFRTTEHWIESRNTRIPLTMVRPPAAQASQVSGFVAEQPTPLVLLLHGHGGTRHEAGGFTALAEQLAIAGVSSIRMDFAGCGDSTEPWRNNTLYSQLADVRAAKRWALANIPVVKDRVGLLGFSMGGRIALTLVGSDPDVTALALWAPSAAPGVTGLVELFGGKQGYQEMRDRASARGFARFTTAWGQQQELSRGWFEALEGSQPLVDARYFEGDLLVLYGDQDEVVPPAEALSVVAGLTFASTRVHRIAGADHGLGLFSDQPEYTREAVQETVRHFLQAWPAGR